MEFILLVVIIGVAYYLRGISDRLHRVEAALRERATDVPAQSTARPTPQPLDVRPQPDSGVVLVDATPIIPVPATGSSPLSLPVNDISPTQWVGGIGVLALLFGLAFFFKYAIEQGWITEWMRIVLGLVVGGLFVTLGELWKKKYTNYAQVLTGGGIAILYFSIFASYQFYHKVEQPIAFICMIAVTALGIVLSYRYNAKALAVLAVVGGYITPILISSGENKQVSLFAYLTVLNVGVLLMLLRQYWIELLFIALMGTGLDFALWGLSYSAVENTPASVAFLVFNYLLVGMITATIFRKLHEDKQLPPNTDIHLGIFYTIFGFLMFGTITGLLYDQYHAYLAPVMLLLSVVTFLSYAVMDRLDYVKINYPVSFIGSKFLVAAILFQFSGYTADIYVLAAAALGLGVGFLVNRKDLRTWGLVLFLLAGVKIAFSTVGYSEYVFLFNPRFALEVLVAIGLLALAWMYEHQLVDADEKSVPDALRGLATALVWWAGSQELVQHFDAEGSENARNLLLSVWWMLYAVVLAIVGSLQKMAVFRKAAALLFGITVLKVFLYDVQALELGYRIVSFILLGVILLSVAFAYQKNKDKLQRFLGDSEKNEKGDV